MLLLRVSPRVEYAITIDIHILANYLQILNVYTLYHVNFVNAGCSKGLKNF